ncbi:MAG: peptidoglycan bridge formation glycyltransferase FemA/FemB family protein [Eubacteriales bacterium]|nr:peptidoglycan bridge formation glycyltransferase FemA/FemB family protein [Eubacteriales bacterium]MDY3332748.1 peptidoglycan bridge formation glycyltransferase FemA/FemB family protein [Gallibacter sp.]
MYKFLTEIDKAEYDEFVASHPLNSLLQSYNWKEIKDNWTPIYTGVKDGEGKLKAAGLMLIQTVKGLVSVGYMPRGPIFDYNDRELLDFYFSNLKKLAKAKKLLFIKMDPKVVLRSALINDFVSAEESSEALSVIEALKQQGFYWKGKTIEMGETFQPRFDATTFLCDDFKKVLSSATRQKINRAEKKNVVIRKSNGSKEDLMRFQDILEKTMERKSISLRDVSYFEKMVNAYPDGYRLSFAELHISETRETLNDRINEIEDKISELANKNAPKKMKELEQNKAAIERSLEELNNIDTDEDIITLAGIISIGYGDTLEMLYAGFDVRYKTYFAQYLLYLKTMEEAYSDGFSKACMGGIQGSLNDGLLEFKQHFVPNIEEYIGEFDLATSPLYHLINGLYNLKKKIRKMRKK